MALTKPTRHGRHQHTPAPRPPDIEPEPLDEEDEIQQLCQELNDAGYTAEISWGQVVVSPKINRSQSNITFHLMDQLFDSARANGWFIHSNWGVHIPPFPDMRLPDLMVAPKDAEQYDDMHILGHSALLVAEVCSRGTRSVDWDEKPLEYARAGVPLLLIIDPVTDPETVTLMTEPLKDLTADDLREPYQRIVMVQAGEPLWLPAPFKLKIDTAALFE
ncbi:Uma2 family endonuclease [Planotetraspora sp. A-T 1434]|uniref:Uma2 family endonuclease n=1 Tax=Planotetraspora sp. A-T 1434 TaxID=2979219 RepID=UPI0021BE9D6C|nr:Uma2 family endonuclease [Planotetraspora sp. A-T 1434]MCT9932548.1 Uma2 family endonuclease [Planotetraspora sp. A-T 1434]